jgi:hypothetical protein
LISRSDVGAQHAACRNTISISLVTTQVSDTTHKLLLLLLHPLRITQAYRETVAQIHCRLFFPAAALARLAVCAVLGEVGGFGLGRAVQWVQETEGTAVTRPARAARARVVYFIEKCVCMGELVCD